MAVFFALVLVAVTSSSLAFDMSQSTRCVTIPNQLRICKDVGYSEMRLPNFLGHSDLGEVVPHSEGWRSLLQTGCHPQAQTFLCSIIAPVCLDTWVRWFKFSSLTTFLIKQWFNFAHILPVSFIQPCRSLCVAVRDSCAPVLACQGHLWPEVFDCDRFPTDEDVCLSPHGKFNHFFKGSDHSY